VLPFGWLWYDTPDNATGYAMHSSRSHDAVTQNRKAIHFATKNPKKYDLFLKGEYALDRAWKSGGFPLSYFLSRMGDPMSSGGFLKNKSK